jgi:DNA polymerase-3 subunit epsilon
MTKISRKESVLCNSDLTHLDSRVGSFTVFSQTSCFCCKVNEMKLNLVRPLALIDLETTGINVVKDRIVQIAVLKVLPNGGEETKTHKVNPTIPIPPQASKFHGIYDDDVKFLPTFAQVADDFVTFLNDSDLAGYNSNRFDIPLLVEEFYRAGIDFHLESRNIVDVQTIFHKMEPRNLRAAYKFYCGKDLIGAHDAEVDIRATYEVLKAQIECYLDVPYEDEDGNSSYPIDNNIESLSQFTQFNFLDPTGRIAYNDQQQEIFNFGKYKGKTLAEVYSVEKKYLDWIIDGCFSVFTKKAVQRFLSSIKLPSENEE